MRQIRTKDDKQFVPQIEQQLRTGGFVFDRLYWDDYWTLTMVIGDREVKDIEVCKSSLPFRKLKLKRWGRRFTLDDLRPKAATLSAAEIELVLRELNDPQWIDHAPWTIARDLGWNSKRAFNALLGVSELGYAQHLHFWGDDHDYYHHSFYITKGGLDKIGEQPQPCPGALPGNKFVHVLGDRRLHPENYTPEIVALDYV